MFAGGFVTCTFTLKFTAEESVPSADFVIGLPPISVTTPSNFLSG